MAKLFCHILINAFRTHFRARIKFILEVLIILAFLVVIIINPVANNIYYKLEPSLANKTKAYESEKIDNLNYFKNLMEIMLNPIYYTLAYAPSETFATTITEKVVEKLKLRGSIGFNDSTIMRQHFNHKMMLAAIKFPHVKENDVPERLDIEIEFPYNFRTFNSYQTRDVLWITRCRGILSSSMIDSNSQNNLDLYLREGFLQLQNMIFLEWYNMLAAKQPTSYHLPEITLRSFRHFINDDICQPTGTSNLITFLYYFMFLLPFLNLIWRYGREVEANLLVHHWRYGCGYVTFWFAHFIVAFVHLLLLDFLVLVLLKVHWIDNPMSGTFEKCDVFGLLIFLVLYSVSLIVFVMVLVSLIPQAKNALYIGITLWLLSFCLLFTTMKGSISVLSPLVIISIILFFNSGIAYGLNLVKNTSSLTEHSDIFILFGLMLGNIVFNLCVLSLVTRRCPGQYVNGKGLSRCRKRKKSKKGADDKPNTITLFEPTPSWHNFEFGPVGGVDLMRMKNVCTSRKRNQRIVQYLKNVSMRIYKNEITVILGPKCSGKTTLVRVLGGLKSPDDGWVQFEDKDIYKQWRDVRDDVDICMGRNAIIDLLTADETLRYHLRIRRRKLSAPLAATELNKWNYILKPYIPRMTMYTKQLTYGQQCLLCLCCAMIGGTKIILLDQPTIYMNGSDMVAYWSILQREKNDRVIVLTTCSVEEAETLADRVALLNNGTLRAYGTPFFIKTKYSVGYNLIILKASNVPSSQITEFLGKLIPGILPENEIGDQLIYKIPAKKRPLFQRILMSIEKEAKTLGIDNVRMIGADLSEAYMAIDKRPSNQFVSTQPKVRVSFNGGDSVVAQQFYAMLYKKLVYQAPNIVPLIMVGITVIVIILIQQITKNLVVPVTRSNDIMLGFSADLDKRPAYLERMNDCNFVEIKKLNMGSLYEAKNTIIRTFENGSLSCEHESYMDYISKPKIYEKLGGVEINTENYTAWYNQGIFHTASISLNLLHNLILMKAYPNNPHVMTTVVNDPSLSPLYLNVQLFDQKTSHLRLPLTIGIIIPTAISCFILFLVEERQTHMLQLQIMAGIRMIIYWTVNFIWDWGTYLAYTAIFMLVMAFCTIKGFILLEKLFIMLIICIYGCVGLVMVYLISHFCYTSLLRAYSLTLIIQLLTGLCAFIFYWDVTENNRVFYYIAMASPTFCFLDTLSDIYAVFKERDICRKQCKTIKHCNTDNYCDHLPLCCELGLLNWLEPGILMPMTCMLGAGLVFIVIIVVVHIQRKDSKFAAPKHLKQYRSLCYAYEDKDVINMKQYIANADMRECRQYRMVVDQLESRIPDNTRELQTVSFALDKSVCMGIFGTHKSEKSHLAKQMIGEHGFCFGDIYIKSTELKYELANAYKHMSYCPQDGGYFKLFKPRELLRIFCLIGGVRNDQISNRIREVALSMNMHKYMGRPIKQLSFEKRRKVAIAIALVLNRDVIILDEPTRGLPAYSRREIWNLLRFQRFCEKTIIITSTDRMECEALTDFVIVFDKGQMLALGSTQYLRQKFITGFFLEIKLKRDGATAQEANANFNRDVENLNRFVTYLHEDSEVWSRVDNILKYYVPVKQTRFSHLFGALEKNKRRLNISDYTINQGTMVDVMRNIFASREILLPSSRN